MSRSGYNDDCDGWALIRWRGAVASATRGQRGQQLLRELLAALDAMPDKALITEELEGKGGHCALGVLGKQRGLPIAELDPYDRDSVANAFGIAKALAAEIVFMNDEGTCFYNETPVARWRRMRSWVAEQITKEAA